MAQKIIISNSEIGQFKRCRQKWFYAKLLGLRRKVPDIKLFTGGLTHWGMQHFYEFNRNLKGALFALKKRAKQDYNKVCVTSNYDDRVIQNFRSAIKQSIDLVKAYANFAKENDDFKVIAVEKRIEIDMKDFKFVAKGDAVVKSKKGLGLLEHKTTARFDKRVVDNLILDEQATRYSWAYAKHYAEQVKEILYNFLVKTKKPYVKRVRVYRTKGFLDNIEEQLKLEFDDMYGKKPHIYRNPTRDCSWDCEFLPLCIAELDGSDSEYIKESMYEKVPDYRRDRTDKKKGG